MTRALLVLLLTLLVPGVSAAVPTMVQHVATGMEFGNFITTLNITLPNPARNGNVLILGVQFNGNQSVTSVVDNQGGNTWVAGPTAANSTPQTGRIYTALNVVSGTQNVIVSFSAFSQNGRGHAVLSEWYNVATSSAVDGSSANPTSLTAGSITTTANGDLIYHWGFHISDSSTWNGSTITAGSGFTLLSADVQVGSADQYQIQTTAGAINPIFTVSGSDTWASVAIALKAASAGTPPLAGIRIVNVQHTLVANPGQSTPLVIRFPSSGNLLVGLFNSANVLVTGITDSAGNIWASAGSVNNSTPAQILYAQNATTSPTLSSIALTINGTSTGHCMFVLFDVTGAATSAFDVVGTASGNQVNQASSLTMAGVTPTTANGLVVNVGSISFHTTNAIVGAGFVLDAVVNALNDDAPAGTTSSTLDEDNPYGHFYNASSGAPVTFVYSMTQSSGTGVAIWSSVTAAFKAAPLPPPPSALTGGIGIGRGVTIR